MLTAPVPAPTNAERLTTAPQRPLRIAQVSKADASGGGASRVAQELTALLRRAGHDAVHFASWWKAPRPDSRSLYGERLQAPIRRLHQLTKRFGLPELVPAELAILVREGVHRYDVVHFHDLSSAISPLTVFAMSHLVPTLWTVHDCSPFTAGCLYPLDCERFRAGCGACPQLGTWPLDTRRDLTALLHRVKRFTARAGRIRYVTPSRWASELAFSSGLLRAAPEVLPNGVDTQVFRPRDRAELRRRLGLPNERPIVLLSAGDVLDERKGARYALAALRRTRDVPWFVLVVGNFSEQAREALEGLDHLATGYLSTSERLAEAYAAADLFLFCSLADNLPLVVLEAMACGTPTVGFATGGVPEMVETEVSGLLVPPRDVAALAGALRRAADPGFCRQLGRAARLRMERHFSHARFLARHLALYRGLATASEVRP